MKKLILFLIVLSASLKGYAQSAATYTIKGIIVDTLNDAKLQYASITILRAKDSVLEAYTRSKEDGTFTAQVSDEGSYTVLVTFPSFADYVETVKLSPQKPEINMGKISMVTRAHLLSEFVLKQQIAAIKIKGDTTEYVADSFKVREGATVEELLRKLPGIQVSKNGDITAQGETVQKIMVDGEEFFTDDPKIVTKSLQAKAVDKVQVFDKKSEQAEFTGIDDGVREKTINLKLKDNMKRGFFGKAVAGGGTNGFFENQLMLNAFKNKRQLSFFGIAANTGKMGLGWQDRDKYGSGDNMQMSDEGYMYTTIENDGENIGWDGNYTGQGLPSAWTSGLHYANKWLEDKLHFSANYRYAKQNISTTGNTLTQYNLDTLQYYNDEKKSSFNSADRHGADVLAEYKPDSLSAIRFTANAGYKKGISKEDYISRSIDTAGTVFNNNERHNYADATTQKFNTTLSYKRKFKKKGRSLSAVFTENYNHTETESQLKSIVTSSITGSSYTIDQLKQNQSENLQLGGTLSYTEPLSKVLFLELNYGLSLNNNYSKRFSYNPNATGDYNELDSVYSSNYNFDVMTNKGGSNLRFVFKKVNLSFGGAVASTDFNQHNNFTDITYKRNFLNFFPSATLSIKPRKQQSIYFSYNGSTQQPTIDQIQPLKQNTDPLNISVGNPNLNQKFNHRFNLRYNDYKVFSGTYTYAGVGFTFVNNDISQAQYVSDNFIRTYQYVNVNGNYNGWGYGGWGRSIRKLDAHVGMNTNINFSNYNSYVNYIKNTNENRSISLGVNGSYNKDSLCEIELNFDVTYNNNYASINKAQTNYFTYNTRVNISFELPKKFEIGTEVNWNIRQKVVAFNNNNNVFLWNGFISKKFLKDNSLELKATGYDMLNQNKGFSRVAYGNTITQQSYNTIRRYFMLSLIWNFTKTAMGQPQNDNANILISN